MSEKRFELYGNNYLALDDNVEEKTYYLVINYKKTKSSPTSSITFKTKNFYKPSDIEIFIGNLRPLINEKMNIEL